MAKLSVKYKGHDVTTVELEEGRDYMIGRGSSCQIRLKNEPGISRQHARVYQRDNQWKVELVSRVGDLFFDGLLKENIDLQNDLEFHIPPYQFVFLSSPSTEVPLSQNNIHKELGSSPNLPQPIKTQSLEEVDPQGNLDCTDPGTAEWLAYLKVCFDGVNVSEVHKLEGQAWVAGRDPSCEIVLNNDHVSRRHFELVKNEEGFFISDLGSANGTEVNGEALEPNRPYRLDSGDHIEIMSLKINFEIHDAAFDKQLQLAPNPSQMQMDLGLAPPYPMMAPNGEGAPRVVRIDSSDTEPPAWSWEALKKNKVRLAIVLLAPIILYGLFKGSPVKKKSDPKKLIKQTTTFTQLSPEQKAVVKDTFNLARTHYLQGKYELCSDEVKRVHEIIPYYENSKELESLCAQAFTLAALERERERQKLEREQTEAKIRVVTEGCREKFENLSKPSELEQCLLPAIELNPEHPLIADLRQEIQIQEQQRLAKAQQLAHQKSLQKSRISKYKQAQKFTQQGELKKAIKKYSEFLSGGSSGVESLVPTAKRELAAVRSQLQVKVGSLKETCQKGHGGDNLKEALMACDKALKLDTQNKEIKELRHKIYGELKKQLKNLYSDSVIEEDLGNVSAAQEKWKIIKERDLPGGVYYKKASRKLKKYGASF